ncbi:MAG TPA: hypothetical protein VNO50_06325 [Pyrinomonadaceae bacterium]|nr:hypothetical protein [Pyrinomonadaceae bacterium]
MQQSYLSSFSQAAFRQLQLLIFGMVLFVVFVAAPVSAQDDKPVKTAEPKPTAENIAKAEQIVTRATEVVGGGNYLNVKTVLGRGYYTPFLDGISQVPSRFVDYISYPDRERTEFIASGIRTIQTNSQDTGWFFDGATKTISDMKPEQIQDFKRGMRTSVENLLHGWWRKEGATLSYVGRREAGLAKRNEVVRLTYPEGFWIEYEFGAKDGLPAKMIYKKSKKKVDSEEVVETNEEDRIARTMSLNGITAAWIIDHYVEGVQTSRVNYESIEYNKPLADNLFAKPANIKALKN